MKCNQIAVIEIKTCDMGLLLVLKITLFMTHYVHESKIWRRRDHFELITCPTAVRSS